MNAAVVSAWGSAPKYVHVPLTQSPSDGEHRVKVLAVGLHRVVRSRASGTHYSAKTLPHIPGVDGVGELPDGSRVYFSALKTGGSFAEYVDVPKTDCVPLPDGVDHVRAAALVNPALSSWMAVKARCQGLRDGFNIVILGATSASGRLAAQLVRQIGAGKVIGVARNVKGIEGLGLDGFVKLEEEVEKTDFSGLGDVDVVIDYVWGDAAVHLMKSLESRVPTQYMHVGSLGGRDISLDGAILRSRDLTIRGSGHGAFRLRDAVRELPGLLTTLGKLDGTKIEVFPMNEVERVWNEEHDRIVFVP